MTQKIYRTKKYAVLGACVSFLGIWSIIWLLNDSAYSDAPAVVKLEGVLNISLLLLTMFFIRCLVLTFRNRLLLQGAEKGLYINVSKKNSGIIPWRHISHFIYSQDQRAIRVYLQGLWDVPDDCGERFDIQTDENRKRMVVLPLHRKVRDVKRVCGELEEWRLSYSDAKGSAWTEFDDEAALRRAASLREKGALSALIPLYFLRSKFWLLALVGYLICAALIEDRTTLSRPAVLGVAAVPAVLAVFVFKKLLSKAISALERDRGRNEDKMRGL